VFGDETCVSSPSGGVGVSGFRILAQDIVVINLGGFPSVVVLVVLRDIVITDFYILLEILIPQTHDSHVHFSVSLLVIFRALGFRQLGAGAEKVFHPIEG
jgi:hypothetical protein